MIITITEALADIKTSMARIQKKRETITNFLARDSRLRDPMEADGGSKEFVRRERQAIRDLEEKIVRYRTAIQKVNLGVNLTIEGVTRSISEWLNWRREIAVSQKAYLSTMAQRIKTLRDQAVARGQTVRESDTGNITPQGDLIVAVSESELAAEIEQMENVLGQLDGKLSLLNATVTIGGD